MPEIGDYSGRHTVKRRWNWDRIMERAEWLAFAMLVALVVAELWISEFWLAFQCFVWAAVALMLAIDLRNRAKLADHDAVVRVYGRGGRLLDQMVLDFPPGSGLYLAGVHVTVAGGCTCGEPHDDEAADGVVREPHKDEL